MSNKPGASSVPLAELLAFVAKTNQFREIERVIFIKNSERRENDLEHSGQLALLALYLTERMHLSLDVGKVLSCCLVHDLVELYAGDVYAFDTDKNKHAEKAVRETEALETLRREFPHATSMWDTILDYQEKRSEEARFVYALDKLVPMWNHILHGSAWKILGIDLETLEKNKASKVMLSPHLLPLYEETIACLCKHEERFFNKKTV